MAIAAFSLCSRRSTVYIQHSSIDDQTRDSRLRSMARRMGYRLVKSRCRVPEAPVYGTYGIISKDNVWVAYSGGNGYGLDLDGVEAFLRADLERTGSVGPSSG
jgi:hypothetical protein